MSEEIKKDLKHPNIRHKTEVKEDSDKCRWNRWRTASKMVCVSPAISVITLTVNAEYRLGGGNDQRR